MRLLHCGDLHLDSPLSTNLSNDKRKLRRSELLGCFVRIVDYAVSHEADAILIAGDLFDTHFATKGTEKLVQETILMHPELDFLYLRGNHDGAGLSDEEFHPANLKRFSERFTSYRYGNTVIGGAEVSESNVTSVYDSFVFEKADCNILVLHGQVENHAKASKPETIPLMALKNRNIDYLALGHIHAYRKERLDTRGVYCYCGCPEGRGYDECGTKGFVWVETSEKGVETTFVPFAKREIHEVFVDITGAETTTGVEKLIRANLEGISAEDQVRVSLVGRVSLHAQRDLSYLTERFQDSFFSLSVSDRQVGLLIREEEYVDDISLRGEFIRLVMGSKHTEEEKRVLLELGVRALSGEEVESCF